MNERSAKSESVKYLKKENAELSQQVLKQGKNYANLWNLFQHSFSLNLNMDNVFFGGSFEVELEIHEVEYILPIFEHYGVLALIAYASVKEGIEPILLDKDKADYARALQEVQALADEGTILFERYHYKKTTGLG